MPARKPDPTVEPLAHDLNGTAARMGLGRTTVHHLVKSGQLRSVKVGRRRLVTEDEIRRFLSAGAA